MNGKLSEPSRAKKAVAKRLLDQPNDSLEVTTCRIKVLCFDDLTNVAKTGVLTSGCLLHAILTTAAVHLKLDAGELESLNSMIKSSLANIFLYGYI